MSIDERIQALTESVELLASLHRDQEKRLDQLAREMNAGFALLGGTLQVLGGSIQTIVKATDLLTNIVADHETRVTKLEGGAK